MWVRAFRHSAALRSKSLFGHGRCFSAPIFSPSLHRRFFPLAHQLCRPREPRRRKTSLQGNSQQKHAAKNRRRKLERECNRFFLCFPRHAIAHETKCATMQAGSNREQSTPINAVSDQLLKTNTDVTLSPCPSGRTDEDKREFVGYWG